MVVVIGSAFGTFFFRPEWGNYVRFFLLLRLLRLMSLMGLNKQFRVIFRTFFDSLPKFYNIFSSVLFFFCTCRGAGLAFAFLSPFSFSVPYNPVSHIGCVWSGVVRCADLFNAIGMYCFGGLIYPSNPDLITSDFGVLGYWPINFNDWGTSLLCALHMFCFHTSLCW